VCCEIRVFNNPIQIKITGFGFKVINLIHTVARLSTFKRQTKAEQFYLREEEDPLLRIL